MQKSPICSLEDYPNHSLKTYSKLLKQSIILLRRNKQSKPLEPNNCCKTSSANVLKLTQQDKPIGPPSSLKEDSEEERLEISNALTINNMEDSNPIIAPIIMCVTATYLVHITIE